MKILPAVLLLVGGIGTLAAQDTTKSAPPVPTPVPAPPPAAQPATTGQPAASDIKVEAVLARTVADRAPQDTGAAFADSVGSVVLWMRVTDANGQTLHHVWFHGNDQVGDVSLNIAGSPWRTWSRKTIPADAKGAWHVEIRDAAGATLKRIDFTVGQ